MLLSQDERGASGVEYGLAIAAIAALIVVVAFALGTSVGDLFTSFNNLLGQYL